MRRLLSFECEGNALAGTLDRGDGETGLLLVTGGSQTRIGSHRMYERLAIRLREQGYSCFRYDRRGVGDSEGDDPNYLASGPDLVAAASAFRASAPNVKRIFGFGLCDGATAIALYGRDADLAGQVLVNPWLVEPSQGMPAPAAIGHHYRRRLLSLEGWNKLLSGAVDLRKLLKGIGKLVAPNDGNALSERVARAMRRSAMRSELILASGDATAIAADAEFRKKMFSNRIGGIQRIESDSHTFAQPGDEQALTSAVIEALRRLEAQA